MTTRVWTANGVRYTTGDGYQAAVLPMKATGKARPRVTVKGTFYPASYVRARQALRVMFGTVSVRLPVAMKVTVVRKIAASESKAGRAAKMWRFCDAKPDCDNCEGWVMDALFEEDAAVVWTECVKVWGPRDLLQVELWEVNTDKQAIDGESLFMSDGRRSAG